MKEHSVLFMKRHWRVVAFLFILCSSCAKSMQNEDGHTAPDKQLHSVFQDSIYQLTGVAVSNENRVFTNYPLWSDIYSLAVAEVTGGSKTAYPDMDWNLWKPGASGIKKWVCVQAV